MPGQKSGTVKRLSALLTLFAHKQRIAQDWTLIVFARLKSAEIRRYPVPPSRTECLRGMFNYQDRRCDDTVHKA